MSWPHEAELLFAARKPHALWYEAVLARLFRTIYVEQPSGGIMEAYAVGKHVYEISKLSLKIF